MNPCQKAVHDFMEAMTPRPPKSICITLIEEESRELVEALIDPIDTLPHVIKELCDVEYVAYHAACHHDVDLDVWDFGDQNQASTIALRDRNSWADLIESAAARARWALVTENPAKLPLYLRSLISRCRQAGASFGLEMTPFFFEVHRSNMDKAGGPRREDGKVMKPPGWVPPNIEGILEKQAKDLAWRTSTLGRRRDTGKAAPY